jgi:hypothetical protein
VALALLFSPLAASAQRCRVGVLDGEVKAGQQYVHRIGSGLEVMLEPLPSGWILRVLQVAPSRPAHDYAELATPPYHSVSPLLLSTDFSFRAQDAVGWTPRRFRYAPDQAMFARLLKAYEDFEAKPGPSAASQQALAELVTQAPGGVLTILDAHLIPGAADQAGTAATLASHFTTTPHVIDPLPDGKSTPLGRITWLRFRIAIELSKEFKPDPRLEVKLTPCGNM